MAVQVVEGGRACRRGCWHGLTAPESTRGRWWPELCECVTAGCACDDGWVAFERDGYEYLAECQACRDVRHLARRVQVSEIPARYARASLERAWPSQVPAVRQLRAWVDGSRSGVGFALKGPVGAGKTTLAVAALKRAMRDGLRLKFVRVYRYLSQLQATFDGPSPTVDAWLYTVRTIDAILLDDLQHFRSSSAWQQQQIAELISRRYDANLIVCTTSATNFDPHITRALGEWGVSVVSRLREMTESIVVVGSDKRRRR